MNQQSHPANIPTLSTWLNNTHIDQQSITSQNNSTGTKPNLWHTHVDKMSQKNQLGPTLWVLQLLPVLATVVHAEHKSIKNERHNNGHHHLERVQAKSSTHRWRQRFRNHFCRHKGHAENGHHGNNVEGHEVQSAPVARHGSDSFLQGSHGSNNQWVHDWRQQLLKDGKYNHLTLPWWCTSCWPPSAQTESLGKITEKRSIHRLNLLNTAIDRKSYCNIQMDLDQDTRGLWFSYYCLENTNYLIRTWITWMKTCPEKGHKSQ